MGVEWERIEGDLEKDDRITERMPVFGAYLNSCAVSGLVFVPDQNHSWEVT